MWIKTQKSPLDDERVAALSNGAFTLWLSGLINAARHGTGDVVPYAWVSPYDDYFAAELCRAGLWDYGNSAYCIRDAGSWLALEGRESRRPVTSEVRRALLARDGLTCGICGGDVSPFDYHIDHFVPLSKGGPDSLDNLQVAHPRCNLSKGSSF